MTYELSEREIENRPSFVNSRFIINNILSFSFFYFFLPLLFICFQKFTWPSAIPPQNRIGRKGRATEDTSKQTTRLIK